MKDKFKFNPGDKVFFILNKRPETGTVFGYEPKKVFNGFIYLYILQNSKGITIPEKFEECDLYGSVNEMKDEFFKDFKNHTSNRIEEISDIIH